VHCSALPTFGAVDPRDIKCRQAAALQRGWPLVGNVYHYLRYISAHFHRNGVCFGSDTNAGSKSASTKGVALFGKRW
jgi:hypothetical protein